jgi:RNA polymerase sigma factor (sigma-70 family)
LTEQQLITACQAQDRMAQKQLYEALAPRMLGVCRRYVTGKEDAEDVLIEAFFKVFDNIGRYEGKGSFEGWVRRIVVNEALMFLRKKQLLTVEPDEQTFNKIEHAEPENIEHQLAAKDILMLLEKLPTGYRTIFNLYVIEGFKHQEIADLLGISINTSKSQLILAKDRLQKMVKILHR